MRLNKNNKWNLFVLILLLLIICSISTIKITPLDKLTNQNSVSLSVPDDNYEENDDPDSSYDLSTLATIWLSSHNGLGNQSDDDWYRIHLDQGEERLRVELVFTHSAGNIDIEVYRRIDSNYEIIAGNYSTNDNEYLELDIFPNGDYYLKVNGSNQGNTYDLWWEDLMPHDDWIYPGDDWMEENDEYGSAHRVNARYYPDLRIKEYDEDWFRIYLSPDTTIEIRIYFDNFQGDLQLELYDPYDPNNRQAESYNDWNDEYIFFTADISGDWRFRVFRVSGDYNTVVHYKMEIWINGTMEGDDPYEPNNSPDRAYDLRDYEGKWLSKIHGVAVQGDEDWYLIDVTPGFQHLIVNLTFNHSQGNINIELYRFFDRHDLDWNPLYSNYSITGENRAVINYTYIDPGMYAIQIRGDFTGVEYNMWWDDKRTDLRSDDNYEENDDAMNAYDLSFHEHEDLGSINDLAILNDSDWYKIQVDPGFEHLFVLVMYDYQEGAIGIQILKWDGSQVDHNMTEQDNEIFSYDLPSNGTYYIRIFGDTKKRNIYNLRWETWSSTGEMIHGYDLFILLGAIFGVVVLFSLKWKRSKNRL